MDETAGSIVAFEGNQDIISTQLRLLPTSSRVLILPSVECYLPADDLEHDFEPHQYIRKIHDASQARNEVAQEFLQGSTASQRRLVFMNGGTPNAHALCIKAIMKHETDGDAAYAETIFEKLVHGGLGGLEAQGKDYMGPEESYIVHDLEDPITRAMRAADALDRLTESLQPSNEVDLTLGKHSRSLSLPLYGYSDDFQDAAPFFVFGASLQENKDKLLEEAFEELICSTTPHVSARRKPLSNRPTNLSHLTLASPQRPPSCIGEAYDESSQAPLSPVSSVACSDAASPRYSQNFILGEAELLDMRVSSRKVVRRIRSLDRVYPTSPKYRDPCLTFDDPETQDQLPNRIRPKSCMVVPDVDGSWSGQSACIDGPRTVFVKPKKLNISIPSVSDALDRESVTSCYIDQDADVEETLTQATPFEPVLPFTESLVIYFKEDTTDGLLESIIGSFKEGRYPIAQPGEAFETDTVNSSVPATPQSQQMRPANRLSVVCEEPDSPFLTSNEKDPFAYTHSPWSHPRMAHRSPAANDDRPPTPAKTPTLSMADQNECFHDFHIAPNQTAVAIQNTLRSILSIYYPPQLQGHQQFHFMLPELQGLWKPVFRETASSTTRKSQRQMDQILAIGSQRGVSKEYSSMVVGQLEKLGVKPSGLSRSGRLDFRYLLAKAMQAFTAQPLTNQSCDNPFTNPYLLATLIVPHLETHLALHPGIRYLLFEYPPEHLATILALQKLVGVDLMKVAQIVDSNSDEELPFTHIRGASISSNRDGASTPRSRNKSMSPSPRSSVEVPLSKGNFLLTSTASEAEIATFVETIHKILVGVSPFYNNGEVIKKPITKKPKPAPLQSSFSPFPKVTALPQLSLPVPSSATTSCSASPVSLRVPSISETIRTKNSSRSKYSRSTSRRYEPSLADGWSVFTLDLADDKDLDMEERRLIPLFLQPSRRPEGDSKKALKFLGLA